MLFNLSICHALIEAKDKLTVVRIRDEMSRYFSLRYGFTGAGAHLLDLNFIG